MRETSPDPTDPKQIERHAMVGPAGLWQMKRDFQFHFLANMKLQPEHYLLDIGCGTLRGGIPLIRYLNHGHYYGIESRSEVLQEGVCELNEAGLACKNPFLVVVSDIDVWNEQRKFDMIWAFSVLIHMSDHILMRTLQSLNERVTDNGVFYANVNIGDRDDLQWQGFPVVWRSLAFYHDVCAACGWSLTDLGPLKRLGHVSGVVSQDQQHMLELKRLK